MNNVPRGFPTQAYLETVVRELETTLRQAKATLERLMAERQSLSARVEQLVAEKREERARADAACAVLREVEWLAAWLDDGPAACPICGGRKDGPVAGHARDCRLAEVLHG